MMMTTCWIFWMPCRDESARSQGPACTLPAATAVAASAAAPRRRIRASGGEAAVQRRAARVDSRAVGAAGTGAVGVAGQGAPAGAADGGSRLWSRWCILRLLLVRAQRRLVAGAWL